MVVRSARYVLMPDATRIAVTVYRPDVATPVPAVLRATRYWRLPADGEIELFTGAGLALVLVDVRGTGASYGIWRPGWSRQEIGDLREVVEWLTRQPWCSGAIGAVGGSYDANTALLLAAECHPAVRAVVPVCCDYDPYTQISHPGGVLLAGFIGEWSAMTSALDRGDASVLADLLGLEPAVADDMLAGLRVDEDADGSLLAAAFAEHAANPVTLDAVGGWLHRDDSGPESSPRARRAELERSRTAIWLWASWYDAGTGAGAVEHFRGSQRRDRVTILASTHCGERHASPYSDTDAPQPSIAEQQAQIVEFLRAHLTADSAPEPTRSLEYWTIGAEAWRQSADWPPPGVRSQRLFLTAGGGLGETRADGTVQYRVDPTAGIDPRSSHWNQFRQAGPILFPDRQAEDTKLLCHTGAPLASPLELTGEPVVALQLSSTHRDGVVFAYLESVAPDGSVRSLTEGNLRLSHRSVADVPALGAAEPFHSHLSGDAAPMIPGTSDRVSFALLPFSAVIPAGHRLRLALAGANHGTFAAVPDDGTPEWTVDLATSWLELPVVGS